MTTRTHRSPDRVWAGGGAVNQHDGKLPIYVCNDCGREVVWVTSPKTGRKYLANIAHGQNGYRFYIGASVHACNAPGFHNGIYDGNREYDLNAENEYDLWTAAHYRLAVKDPDDVLPPSMFAGAPEVA